MTRSLALAALVSVVIAWSPSGAAQTAVRGGEVHPVRGDPIEEGVVVVGEDGRIEAVGGPDTEIPEEAEVIDASDGIVTPGWIDANTHLGLVEVWAEESTRDDRKGGRDAIRAAFRTADGINPSSSAIPVARAGGVTSVVSVPNGGIVSGQSAWVDLGGAETGYARLVEESAAMHIRFGQVTGGGGIAGLKSRAGLMEKLRELFDDVAYYREHRQAFNENQTRDFVASRLDLEVLTKTVDGTLPTCFATNRASDIEKVVEFAERVGVDPIVFGGAEAWKVRERLAEADVPVVLRPTSNLPATFDELGARMDAAARLADAGVSVIISSFGTHNVRKLKQMAGNAIRAGLAREAALRAVTLHPARAFGFADRYGSLESGKVGNIVVWSGEPFEISTHVEEMIVQGEQVSLDNRQRELFERYRELERGEGETSGEDDGGE